MTRRRCTRSALAAFAAACAAGLAPVAPAFGAASPAPLAFARTDYPAGLAAQGLAVGDLNRDGMADLAVAKGFYAAPAPPHTQDVSVLLGNGAGGFSAASSFQVDEVASSVAVGDFDGDGNPRARRAGRLPQHRRGQTAVRRAVPARHLEGRRNGHRRPRDALAQPPRLRPRERASVRRRRANAPAARPATRAAARPL